MQTLAMDARGAGAPLVAVHGWGFGRHVFDPVLDGLAARHRVVRVDLPGCGESRPDRCGDDLDAIAASVLDAVPQPAWWLGWSLGGLVALAAARQRPQAVAGVTLVAASPCFPAFGDWPGIHAATLVDFARAAERDPAGVHARFLQLQLAGSARARPALRALRAAAAIDGVPEGASLRAGLRILATTDLRGALGALSCQVAAIMGEADPLVPVAVEPSLGAAGVLVERIAGAGHAPFASHPDAFLAAQAVLEQELMV
ncbi:MAG: alpha/beta fold hydrolase [Halofilum sp. (in: g-proteobacteria)]